MLVCHNVREGCEEFRCDHCGVIVGDSYDQGTAMLYFEDDDGDKKPASWRCCPHCRFPVANKPVPVEDGAAVRYICECGAPMAVGTEQCEICGMFIDWTGIETKLEYGEIECPSCGSSDISFLMDQTERADDWNTYRGELICGGCGSMVGITYGFEASMDLGTVKANVLSDLKGRFAGRRGGK